MRISYRLSIILIICVSYCLGTNNNILAGNKNSSVVSKPSQNDKLYRQVFEEIKKRNWEKAENLADQLGDRALFKIVESQSFLDEIYQDVDFTKIINFLNKNPKWPQRDELTAKAEHLINNKTDKTQIYNWFKKRPPITGTGHKFYALAADEIIKDQSILASIIKNGWIYGSFGVDEQTEYYNKFKKYLNMGTTVERIDNLLWKGSTTAAKNSLHLVSPAYKKTFEAHMAFINEDKNSEKLFKNISKEYYTQGLIYQYINSKKKDLPSAKEMSQLINLIKKHKGHEGDFWKLQSYLAREYIEHKKFNDAYLIASSHFAVNPANISDAEFLAGWIALRMLNKPSMAIEHFRKFNKVVKTPMSISRGIYWLARAYARSGNKAHARKLYEQAAHQFGYTFYGQVATMDLGLKKLRLPPKIALANHKNDKYIKNNDLLKAVHIVSKYGGNALAQTYLNCLINTASEEQEVLAIALAMQHSTIHHKVWMSKNAIQKHIFIDHYSYPTPYKTSHLPIEEAFTYSIIRQESVFDQFAISSADARGLMQLIKPTACETAKKIEIQCNHHSLLHDPHYNVTLGSNYLAEMLGKYQNSYILTIAAYNAGPGRVVKWINLYGDPRHFKHPHQVLDWIETIPFSETRNYVQRVLENLQIYRTILNKNAVLNLRNDLLSIDK